MDEGPKGEGLPEPASPQRGLLARIFRDEATSAPVIFSTGNLVWSTVTAEPVGIALNAGVLLVAMAAQARDTIRGKQSGLSFFVTAAVHAASAASTLYNGVEHMGIKEMFNVLGNHEARKYVFTALGRTGWAFAHFIMGYREKYGHDPKHIGTQPVHAGYADIFMTAADTAKAINAPALALISAGLAKAFADKNHPPGDAPTVKNFLLKHVTPNRLFASTFLMGAYEAATNPASAVTRGIYAVAQGLWGYGYALLDGKRNHEIIADVKKLVGWNPKSTPPALPPPGS